MKLLPAFLWGLLALIVAVLGCFGAYERYEWHYLSSDFKRTLTAAMDFSASNGDVATYMRDARLQVRTQRDAQVLQKFENCVQFAKDAAEINDRHFKQVMQSLDTTVSGTSYVRKLVDIESDYVRLHVAVPQTLRAEIHKAIEDEKAERKRDEDIYQLEEQREKQESLVSQEYYKELRVDLGLPALPSAPKTK
jgi:sRNA-binding carbon storage regulator CsrA